MLLLASKVSKIRDLNYRNYYKSFYNFLFEISSVPLEAGSLRTYIQRLQNLSMLTLQTGEMISLSDDPTLYRDSFDESVVKIDILNIENTLIKLWKHTIILYNNELCIGNNHSSKLVILSYIKSKLLLFLNDNNVSF